MSTFSVVTSLCKTVRATSHLVGFKIAADSTLKNVNACTTFIAEDNVGSVFPKRRQRQQETKYTGMGFSAISSHRM